MATAERAVVTVIYDDGSQNVATMNLGGNTPTNALTMQIDEDRSLTAVIAPRDHIRTYDPSQPTALDDQDPGNTDPEQLTAALDPDDDILTTMNQEK